jgi:hypothetical protein
MKASKGCTECSFCGARGHGLIAGPGVFVCGACVDLAGNVIDERARGRPRERG